jgi:hypothetical protein
MPCGSLGLTSDSLHLAPDNGARSAGIRRSAHSFPTKPRPGIVRRPKGTDMPNQHLARGVLLGVIALAFGLGALRYSFGSLVHAGPGLFPLLLSGLLFLLALITIVQSRFLEPEPLYFNVKNIVLIMLALGGFVVISKYVAMILAIAFLVFVASLAGSSHSWRRSLQVTVALIVVAFLFQKFLGLNLKVM